MTPRGQFCAKLGVVINFAIEDDPDRAVLVMDWLLAGRQIDDREPPHAECDARHDATSFVIRTAVADRRAHPPKGGIGVACGVAARVPAVEDVLVGKARYSAHVVGSMLSAERLSDCDLSLSSDTVVRSRCKSAAEVNGPIENDPGPVHRACVASTSVRNSGSCVIERPSTAILASVCNALPPNSSLCNGRVCEAMSVVSVPNSAMNRRCP